MRLLLRSFIVASFVVASLPLRPIPAPAWETRIGEWPYGGGAMRVAFDPAGNVVAGGYTHHSGDLAVATVVKLGPNGTLLWRTDVDPLGSFIESMFVDAAGNVLAQGYAGGIDEDTFGHPTVVKLDGATGVERWRHEGLDEDAASFVVDAAGDAILSLERHVVGTLDETRTLCRKLSGADGSQLWENPDCGRVGAVDTTGNVFTTAADFTTASAMIRKISGTDGHEIWEGPAGVYARLRNGRPLMTVDGGGNVVCARGRQVAKLAGTTGALLWQRSIARLDGIIGSVTDLTTDHNDVVIAGASSYVPNKGSRLFVAKLSAVQGNQKWRKLVAARNRDFRGAIDIAQAVAVDGQGNVVLTGVLDRRVGQGRLVVMQLTRGGRISWTRYPEHQGGGFGRAVAVGPGDTIAVGGTLPSPEGVEAGPFYVGLFSAGGAE